MRLIADDDLDRLREAQLCIRKALSREDSFGLVRAAECIGDVLDNIDMLGRERAHPEPRIASSTITNTEGV